MKYKKIIGTFIALLGIVTIYGLIGKYTGGTFLMGVIGGIIAITLAIIIVGFVAFIIWLLT